MSKEKIRKVIEGMERSGKMRNVVLARKTKTADPLIARTLEEFIQEARKWQGKFTDLQNTARMSDNPQVEKLIGTVQESMEDAIQETRVVIREMGF